MGALESAMAWERLHDPDYWGKLDAEGVLLAARAAGYSEADAQRLASERALQRMRQELPP